MTSEIDTHQADFEFIVKQFEKGHRDAHSVLHWLTRLPNQGGKGISEAIAIEVMFECANRIGKGERFAFKKSGISQLARAVFKECELRQKELDARVGTKIIQELAGRSILDKEINELSDNLVGLFNVLYWKLSEGEPEKLMKQYKKRKSVWTKPISRILPERKGKRK